MKIGDRVRLLKGTEEGVIIRIVDDKYLEVEIDDGFVLPVLIREVVPISPEEGYRFQGKPLERKIEDPVMEEFDVDLKTPRILLAIELDDNKDAEVYLVNITNQKVLFTFGSINKRQAQGLLSGICDPKSYTPLGKVPIQELSRIEKIYFQVIFHVSEPSKKQVPLDIHKSWKWEELVQKTEMTPFLNRPAIQIILEEDLPDIDPELLKEKMMENIVVEKPQRDEGRSFVMEKTVDLHIEKLVSNSESLSKPDILIHQLQAFEKEMDNALLKGLKTIKFIHGIGNGVLRDKIHKALSKNDVIQYYEDADKERFGYGATLIHFK